YRQLGGFTPPVGVDQRRRSGSVRAATLRGEVGSVLPDRLGLIFVGLFADPGPQGQPVSSAVLHRTRPYTLGNVPLGPRYLLAHSVAAGLEQAVNGAAVSQQTLCVGLHGPLKIGPDTLFRRADVTLGPVQTMDPTVLQALLDIRSVALTVGAA